MTLSKLSLRNAQRQAKDYLVYFVTIVLAAALLYAFNGLAVIPVRGDHVEVMASVREHLRRAFELAGEKDDG